MLSLCIGKHPVPVRYGTADKTTNHNQSDQRNDETYLLEMQNIVECPQTQAENDDDRDEHSPIPAMVYKHASDIAVLLGEGTGLHGGHHRCCCTNDKGETKR